VAPDELVDELTTTLGSRREAAWVLEELEGLPADARRSRALELAARRSAGEPLQYLLGHWPFRALDLEVDGRALIPRPETEPLVELALAALVHAGGRPLACDLGCGTGAIALSIAVESRALGLDVEVHATDLSEASLQLARRNAERVGVPGVRFHCGSWYEALPASLHGAVSSLCSNPPYISATERATLARELDFEPELALVAPDGTDGTPGFAAVEAVVVGAVRWLAPGGTLLVEHGESHRDAAVACAIRAGLVEVVDHADLAGRPRTLEARRAP